MKIQNRNDFYLNIPDKKLAMDEYILHADTPAITGFIIPINFPDHNVAEQ